MKSATEDDVGHLPWCAVGVQAVQIEVFIPQEVSHAPYGKYF
jgi:hypothetical protein